MKAKPILFLACLFASLSLFNCSDDNQSIEIRHEVIGHHHGEQSVHFEYISFEQFQKFEAPEAINKLTPFLVESLEKGTVVKDDDNEKLVISTNNITKIVKDGVESFTFFIETNKKKKRDI